MLCVADHVSGSLTMSPETTGKNMATRTVLKVEILWLGPVAHEIHSANCWYCSPVLAGGQSKPQLRKMEPSLSDPMQGSLLWWT